MRRSLAPLLALALSGSLAACGGSSPSAPARADLEPAAAVRAAADTSTGAGSSKFALTSTTEIQGQPLEITGDGVFDYAGREGTLALTLPMGTVEQRVVDGKVYLSLSQQPGTFYELTLEEVQGTSLGGSTDPSASFQSLEAVTGDVTEVGEEQVRGADTTHYRGVLDVEKAIASVEGPAKQVAQATLGRAGLKELPFDAWIDDEGRLRKYVQVLEVPAGPTTGGEPVKSTTTLELFDFGTEVDVEVPPASSVKDGAPLLQALQGGARRQGQ